jgi:hypothetical protein
MTVLASTIIDKAAKQLLDLNNIKWTRSELLGWLNMAQQELILNVPEASATTALVTTVNGARQSIPSDGWMLLSANRNMGTTGTTPGRAIQETRRELLVRSNPAWTMDTATDVATIYIYTPLDKTVFWVYPPSIAGNKIEVTYSQEPVVITIESAAITVDDIYEPILLNYILYKTLMKDPEYAPGVELAKGYLSSFTSLMSSLQTAYRGVAAEMDKV